MADDIKAGDVVELKSGSLPMTVTNVGDLYGTPTAWVAWSDAKQQHHTATYAIAALKKSDL